MCLQAVGGSFNFLVKWEGLTACLLHNEPASYLYVAKLRSVSSEAAAKASLNRASKWRAVDPKPSDLSMARMKRD